MQLKCPSVDCLRDFLDGSIDDAEASKISSHVVECPGCDGVLSSLESEHGDVLDTLRHGVQTENILREPEFEELRNTILVRQSDTDTTPNIDGQPTKGQRLRDYRLIKKIGEGGMGTIYQAVHVHLAKHVALKILPEDKLRSKQSVARFRQEMRAVGRVNHPNVVSASDAGTTDGHHFLVMELVQGADLARIIQDRGPLSVANACEIVRQAATGLQHAHDNRLVHRDVKPSNIMLALNGSVKLLDLGLANLNNSEFESTASVAVSGRLTSVGQIMGTLDYMAPEQMTASPDVDNTADIYALGATLFQLLTGKTPCGDRSEGTPERIDAVLHKPPLDIATLRNDIPDELRLLLLKMLEKNPKDRPQTAIDVASELESFVSGENLVALAEECKTSLDMPSVDVDVTNDVSLFVSRTEVEHETSPQSPPKRPRTFTAIALAAFFFALLAAEVFYIKTNNGTMRVIVMHDSLAATVNGETIRTSDGNRELTIRVGDEKQLVVTQDGSDFKLVTDKFEIERHDKVVVEVTLVKDKVIVSKDGEEIAAKKLEVATTPKSMPTKPGVVSLNLGVQTKAVLRDTLEKNMQRREEVAQEAEENDDTDLAAWIRSDFTGKEALAEAQKQVESRNWKAATDAYLRAYNSYGGAFDRKHISVFKKAGRLNELGESFDTSTVRETYSYDRKRLIDELCSDPMTRPLGYRILKTAVKYQYCKTLFCNPWGYKWKDVPDLVYYLRTIFLPEDFEKPGWAPFVISAAHYDEGYVSGRLNDVKPLYYDREVLQQFAGETRELLKKHRAWHGGWVLLAFLETESGNYQKAAEVLEQHFVGPDPIEVPPEVAWLLGECLAGKDKTLDRTVIKLLEPCLQQIATRQYRRLLGTFGPYGNESLRVSPLRTIAKLYAQDGRNQEARKLLYGLIDETDQHPLTKGYTIRPGDSRCKSRDAASCIKCHRNATGLFDYFAMSNEMTDIGYPVDSLAALARIDASFYNVFSSPKGWQKSSSKAASRFEGNDSYTSEISRFQKRFRKQIAKARNAVTPQKVIEAFEAGTFQRGAGLKDLDGTQALRILQSVGFEFEPDDTKGVSGLPRDRDASDVVVNLMLSVRGEGPDAQATVFSAAVEILELAIASKEPDAAEGIAKLDALLVATSEKHPNSIEAGIVATEFAFLRKDMDAATDRLKQLATITDYPKSDGAAFWLVARHALKNEQTKILGSVLAQRAIAGALAQPNSGLKEAILRERSGIRTN